LDAFVQDAHGANRKGWMFSTGAGKIVEKEAFFQLWPIIQVSPRRDEGIPPYSMVVSK
jgi:hypothetical protein